jgi:hypothetical protein
MKINSAPNQNWKTKSVCMIQASICLALGALCMICFPGQMARADASVTTLQKVLGTAFIVGIYFAIPLISLKSIRVSSLLANVFCILYTPYVAILFLFSGWSAPSAKASHWLLYVLVGNVALFVASLVGAILSFSKRHSGR